MMYADTYSEDVTSYRDIAIPANLRPHINTNMKLVFYTESGVAQTIYVAEYSKTEFIFEVPIVPKNYRAQASWILQ